MLELRPSCEHCDRALPPAATNAMICSYECTFCARCVDDVLLNVCPNCGGGFTPRPVRPASDLRNGNHLANHPAGTQRVYKPLDVAAHQSWAETIRSHPPERR